MPAIKNWVRKSEKVLDQVDHADEERIGKTINANVLLQIEHSMEYSHVANAVEEKRLELHGWVYQIQDGRVEFLNQAASLV